MFLHYNFRSLYILVFYIFAESPHILVLDRYNKCQDSSFTDHNPNHLSSNNPITIFRLSTNKQLINSFTSINIDVIFLNNLEILQTSLNKQSFPVIESTAFKNFAYIDEVTRKFYLNLQALSQYSSDRINFIAVIENQRTNQNQSVISISQYPIIIVEGVSYFLLKTNTCQLDILRIMYVLAHSFYTQAKYLPEIQINLKKAIDLDGSWGTINYMYVVANSSESLSGLRTTDQTKQFIYRESKDIVYEKQTVISENLQVYFTQIFVLGFRRKIGIQLQSIKQNLQSQLNPNKNNSHYYFTYQGIMQGFTKLLATTKPLPVQNFHEINIKTICEQLHEQIMSNYTIFAQQTFSHYRQSLHESSPVLLLSLSNKLKQLNKQIFEPLQQCKRTQFLQCNRIFLEMESNLRSKVKSQENMFIKEIQKAQQDKYMLIVDEEIQRDSTKVIGNQRYRNLGISYEKYKMRVKREIYGVFERITKGKWKEEGRYIKNNKQLLSNLQTRLQINYSKKNMLQDSIKLVQKQNQALKQLSVPKANKK